MRSAAQVVEVEALDACLAASGFEGSPELIERFPVHQEHAIRVNPLWETLKSCPHANRILLFNWLSIHMQVGISSF